MVIYSLLAISLCGCCLFKNYGKNVYTGPISVLKSSGTPLAIANLLKLELLTKSPLSIEGSVILIYSDDLDNIVLPILFKKLSRVAHIRLAQDIKDASYIIDFKPQNSGWELRLLDPSKETKYLIQID
ncbi:MAG: hypothetical protein HRT89_01100 [Lentisphaeria bacterium]|nr:hypothetical protein [Lentisphaeria bacterium]